MIAAYLTIALISVGISLRLDWAVITRMAQSFVELGDLSVSVQRSWFAKYHRLRERPRRLAGRSFAEANNRLVALC